MNRDNIRIGKHIVYLLRHNPEDLTMDSNGYVEVRALLNKLNITKLTLDFIVETNDKKRLAYNEAQTLIRAVQGHSIDVDVNLKLTKPPQILYHGTSDKHYELILSTGGLKKMQRLYVHLTDSLDTAYNVGKRYTKDKVVILTVNAQQMHDEGYKFYLSENNVWLTDCVPLKYIENE